MKNKLTEKQKEILNFIADFISENGFPPTLREIGKHFKIASTYGVKRHLEALKKKGYLNINSYSSRAISINKYDDLMNEKIISISERITEIPLLGRVAAGSPILAEENIEGKISIDKNIFRASENCFAMKVQGDSMIDAGIFEDDLIIVFPQNYAKSGDIVVARLEGELTVKIFDNKNERAVLLPKNKNYSPIDVTNNPEFFIIGKVVGVIRWYN